MDQDEADFLRTARQTNSIELGSTPLPGDFKAGTDPMASSTDGLEIVVSPKGTPGLQAHPGVPQFAISEVPEIAELDEEEDNDTLGPFVDRAAATNRARKSRQRSGYFPLADEAPQLTPPTLPRSRSVMSFKAINDSVDKIVKDIRDKFQQIKNGRGIRLLHDTPHLNQIYYSVFKGLPSLSSFQLPAEGCAATGPVSQAQFDAIVDSAVEAIDAGIAPKLISQGSSGSYFMYDPTGKMVGVFKPKDEEPYGPLSPKWAKWLHRNLFPCFFGRPCLVPNNGYICESAASLLDRQLLTHIVPFTDIVHLSSTSFYYRFFDRRRYHKGGILPNKVGSFQLFLHGYEQADVFLKKYPLPDPNRPQPTQIRMDANGEPIFTWTPEVLQQFREELEKLVILDYIMRNTDRGLDNWMINVEWETVTTEDLIDDQTRVTKIPRLKIGAIDSGLAFPWKHPDEWRSYPFGWLFLPSSIIGQPFSQSTREHFLPMLCSQEWWEESTIVFRHLFSQDSEFQERMWKKQWAVMKGQAFNVVETLKTAEQGPLELVRRTRVMVWDDEMDVPVHVPYVNNNMSSAMETPMWRPSDGNQDGIHSYHDEEPDDIRSFPEIPQDPAHNKPPQSTSATGSPAQPSNLVAPKLPKRGRGSSLSLEAKYRALEASDASAGRSQNMFDELISDADPLEQQRNQRGSTDTSRRAMSVPSGPTSNRQSLVNNVGFSIAEGSQASQRVIVERLQTVTSKPPVFTWC